MSKINKNELAKDITMAEGLKKSLSIAQVKEVMRLTLAQLGDYWRAGNEAGVIEAIKGTKKSK